MATFTLNITKKVPRDVAPQPPAPAKTGNGKLQAIIELIESINDEGSSYQIDIGDYSIKGLKTAVGRVAKEQGLHQLEIWQDGNAVWARRKLTDEGADNSEE